MNKKRWMIPLSILLLAGAAGCANNNDHSTANDSNNNALPLGYYSNENHRTTNNGFLRDNDGGLMEMMDHNLGDEGRLDKDNRRKMLQEKDENGHPKNPTTPLAKTDRNWFQRDNRFSTSDVNYHGHLNKDIGNTNSGSVVDPGFQERITDQIRNRVRDVDNVRSIRSVSYGNTVRISVKLNDQSRAAETKRAIENAVQPLVKDRSVKVDTDEGALGRDRNINNEVRQPEPK
ncbi:YhcN/YlaJ family sporulation lipoprotein [Bacillus sp. FJAT-29814]|uniref:YhcN/YlaJ family sporulation lipoprotein n=1 Tax=Bacillus sp. FJAT-29814 TaxID=1729688 RepID=UPI000832FF90|nr:YhcN/YlaJ family sporulation lipoprotein [Bacillus sp. FJAT-29814]